MVPGRPSRAAARQPASGVLGEVAELDSRRLNADHGFGAALRCMRGGHRSAHPRQLVGTRDFIALVAQQNDTADPDQKRCRKSSCDGADTRGTLLFTESLVCTVLVADNDQRFSAAPSGSPPVRSRRQGQKSGSAKQLPS